MDGQAISVRDKLHVQSKKQSRRSSRYRTDDKRSTPCITLSWSVSALHRPCEGGCQPSFRQMKLLSSTHAGAYRDFMYFGHGSAGSRMTPFN